MIVNFNDLGLILDVGACRDFCHRMKSTFLAMQGLKLRMMTLEIAFVGEIMPSTYAFYLSSVV